MRLSIRWKLILWTCGPILVVGAAVLALNVPEMRKSLLGEAKESLARQGEVYALKLDATLQRVAQAARTSASVLGQAEAVSDESLYRLARLNVEGDPMVYGSCVAFAPGEASGRERFAPYVWRDGDTIEQIDLSKSYDYADGSWDWFRTDGPERGWWTEPYFDEGAGNALMCTYSAPFYRDGKFAGVVTVDVGLEDLRELADELVAAEFVIVSRDGTYVSCPDPESIGRRTIFDDARRLGRPDLEELGRRMIAGERAVEIRPGFYDPRECVLFCAPIPSTGWSIGAQAPVRDAMATVYRQIGARAVTGAVGLALLALGILVVAWRITTPIRRLAEGIGQVAHGNLEARVTGVNSHDELGDLARGFNAMTHDLGHLVEDRARERAAREAMEGQLRFARSIQESLLPHGKAGAIPPGTFDLAAVNAPARQMSGDFYDYLLVSPGRLAFVVADVSGKDVPAALYMAVTRTLLRTMLRGASGPGEVLSRVSDELASESDGGMFVTAFAGVLDIATGDLVYANAGHPPPKVVGRNGRVETFGGVTGMVMGVEAGSPIGEATARLGEGDRLVVVTDGVLEARRNGREFFGEARLDRLLADCGAAAAAEICERIRQTVDDFQGGDRVDDVTVLVVGTVARA